MLGMPGVVELVIVCLVVLLLFGKRLPSVMRSLGSSIVEFKKGANEVIDEEETDEERRSESSAAINE